jgi:hypothetical protein
MALNDSDNVVDFPGASHSISPELEFLLMGLTEAQKQTVIDAFYGFARGDAQGFNARFAVLLQVHALALRNYPSKLQKVFDAEIKTLGEEIGAQQAVVKQSTAEILEASFESQRQVAALHHLVEGTEIRLEKKFREIQQQWDRHTSAIQQAAETVAVKADRLKSVSMNVIILSVATGFMLASVALASLFLWPH